MGTNRRYERHVGAQIDRRIEEMASRTDPIGLTDDELDKSRQRPTWAATPLPVWAWVRYPCAAVRIEGFAIAWTARAVMVEWQDRDTSRRLRVWAYAVERRPVHQESREPVPPLP